VLSTTDEVARLRADEAVEGGGDAWRRSPLRVVDFEARVEGMALRWVGDGLSMVVVTVGNGAVTERDFTPVRPQTGFANQPQTPPLISCPQKIYRALRINS
jgi:hypothetical protein